MTKVTSEILDIFKNGNTEQLRKYISHDWLDENNINVSKYKINNYSPTYYEILLAAGDKCGAIIGGETWAHFIVFKFTNEYGAYRVVPLGISSVSSEYIDPWWSVRTYVCSINYEDKDK
jgi:hypothetical protein